MKSQAISQPNESDLIKILRTYLDSDDPIYEVMRNECQFWIDKLSNKEIIIK